MSGEGLTKAEMRLLNDRVVGEATPLMISAVERILADRLAAVQAEADRLRGLADMYLAEHDTQHTRAEYAEAERDTARRDALREAADFIEATAGIGAGGNDYADGWYDALAYALGELRSRAALASPSAAQHEGEVGA